MKSTVIHWIVLTSVLCLYCFSELTEDVRAQPYIAKSEQAVPGPIVMWSGTLADIPEGWRLCDGKLGTPDLRDRFVLGIKEGHEIGETGGAHEVELTLVNLPSHVHPFVTAVSGAHAHGWLDKYSTGTDDKPSGVSAHNGVDTQYKGTNRISDLEANHDHTGVTDSEGKAEPIDNRPAFYRLAFITRPAKGSSEVPVAPGCIVIWSPAMALGGSGRQLIPAGWKICDGTGGTPELTDRFILGVRSGQNPGETGGTHSLALAEKHLPPHTHPFRTDPDGAHDHEYEDTKRDPVIGISYGGLINATTILVENSDTQMKITDEGGEHFHAGKTDDRGDGAMIDNRPAYCRMPFLMMTSPTARIPERAIAIWSGQVSRIPAGWQLCDGSRGTPDLRDRFVLGGLLRSETGGSNEVQLTVQSMARHGHFFATDPAGKHDHEVEDQWRMSSYVWAWSLGGMMGSGPYVEYSEFTFSDGVHTHTGITDSAGSRKPSPYDNRPAYYKAAFIMRM